MPEPVPGTPLGRQGILTGLIAVAALTCAAPARAAAPDEVCRNGSFPETELRSLGLARVVGGGQVHFLEDGKPNCPREDKACEQRAYVVRGDEVITGRVRGPFTCAFFPNRVGGSAGWVKSSDLAPVTPGADPPMSAWVGQWRDGDDTIRLTAKGPALEVAGDAYWPSANPPPDQRPGGPNVGELAGLARPRGRTVVFGESVGCRAELALVGAYLVVADNSGCGGMNVRFNGVYRRKGR